ncbi:MAG TPA: glycosyl hydrolase family 18 protein, partial [Nannocystaceae bacterium]|nr:glycosyl hydrolase family 18 protein [Nannocystaceae bacterium]
LLLALTSLHLACTGDAGTSVTDGASTDPTASGASTTSAATAATESGGAASTTATESGSSASSDPTATATAASTTDATSAATDPTATTTDPTAGGEACVDDHRVIAYVANWQECPTPAQMAQWSHVVIAFAVTYTWTPNGVVCDESCTLTEVPGCNGKSLAELTADLHAAGVRVLLSFGGASMGGVWEGTCGQMTKCWDHCLDKTQHLVDQLGDLVADNDLDGVDIDYEYCLHDAAHNGFVGDLTAGLRVALDALPGAPKLLTHAPMDSQLHTGDPYFEIVADHASDLDFLMPQYYNGGLSPFEPAGLAAIEDHYRDLVDGPFGGDASRLVFGFCIEPGCNPLATQPAAVDVAEAVDGWYPNAGGVFFWAHPNEYDAWFSTPLREHYDALYCPG